MVSQSVDEVRRPRGIVLEGSLVRGEPWHWLPDPVVIEMASRYWGMRSLYAADDLGYKCRDPRETLRDTVDWLRSHHEAFADDQIP